MLKFCQIGLQNDSFTHLTVEFVRCRIFEIRISSSESQIGKTEVQINSSELRKKPLFVEVDKKGVRESRQFRN